MNINEEIVDQKLEGREWADRFGIENRMRRERGQGRGDVVW